MKSLDETSETRVLLYMNLLCLISTQTQASLPYHIPKGKIHLVLSYYDLIEKKF